MDSYKQCVSIKQDTIDFFNHNFGKGKPSFKIPQLLEVL